ncbi:MAG TPA: type II toxin-antitoxin system VapC family toxin [Devosiaceae bacterium]|nr:type II toxin-antitoxin system VapC family toxin [Devosiaceae bacterium]
MIGADSNLLLRLFVDDDAEQHRRAVEFFADRPADDPVYVNVLVLAELVWLLSRRYRYPNATIIDTLEALLTNAGFMMERADLIMSAIQQARTLHTGFADTLIQLLNLDAGCRFTVTFDKQVGDRLPGMELLK